MIDHAHHRSVKLIPIVLVGGQQARWTVSVLTDVHVLAGPFPKVDGLGQASDHFVITDVEEMLAAKCAAKLDQVRSSYPPHFLIVDLILAIPYSAAVILSVDIHGHNATH